MGSCMSDIRIRKTGEADILQTSDGRLTLSVPIQIRRRNARNSVPGWTVRNVEPQFKQQGTLELKLIRVLRDADTVQKPLNAKARED